MNWRAVCVLLVGGLLAATSYSLGVQDSTEDSMDCIDALESLGGDDAARASEAIECLFNQGRTVLPDLVRELRNRESDQFHGECGYFRFTSDTIVVEWDEPAPETRMSVVSEAVLYVIEAILRKELYFGGICRLDVGGKDSPDLSEVQLRIRKVAEALEKLEPGEQRALSLDDFGSLMEEADLSFPED